MEESTTALHTYTPRSPNNNELVQSIVSLLSSKDHGSPGRLRRAHFAGGTLEMNIADLSTIRVNAFDTNEDHSGFVTLENISKVGVSLSPPEYRLTFSMTYNEHLPALGVDGPLHQVASTLLSTTPVEGYKAPEHAHVSITATLPFFAWQILPDRYLAALSEVTVRGSLSITWPNNGFGQNSVKIGFGHHSGLEKDVAEYLVSHGVIETRQHTEGLGGTITTYTLLAQRPSRADLLAMQKAAQLGGIPHCDVPRVSLAIKGDVPAEDIKHFPGLYDQAVRGSVQIGSLSLQSTENNRTVVKVPRADELSLLAQASDVLGQFRKHFGVYDKRGQTTAIKGFGSVTDFR